MARPDRNVPPVGELRELAQGTKVGADRRWWYVAFRRISIYVTWALLHTRVTPNQVTLASLALAFAGLIMIGATAPGLSIAGYVALLAYHLLDRVDGEIARVRNRHSLRGIYLDNAGHYITSAGVFVATTYRLSADAGEPRALWLVGVIGGLAAVMARVEKHAAFHLFSQYVLQRPSLGRDLASAPDGSLTRAAVRSSRAAVTKEKRSLVGRARDAALALTAFPTIVAILLLGTVAEIVWDDPAIAGWTLVAIALIQLLTYVALEIAMLTQSLGSETKRLLEEFEPRSPS